MIPLRTIRIECNGQVYALNYPNTAAGLALVGPWLGAWMAVLTPTLSLPASSAIVIRP